MKKNVYISIIVIGMFVFSGTFVQAKTWMAGYYEKNPMSLDQLMADYGSPLNTIDREDGSKKMIFGPKDAVIGYTYFIVKDGMVVDKNCTTSLGKKTTKTQYAGPTPKGHMANYYKTHPMSVDELTAKLGTPVSNHDYDNGIKKLTFGPKDVETGYTYFLIKDGKVVDKNCTGL